MCTGLNSLAISRATKTAVLLRAAGVAIVINSVYGTTPGKGAVV